MEYDIHSYDKYIVSFSGDKDSTACFLYLLEQGIPKHKIELWHQEIDGREKTFFDWEITPDYCRKFAEAFGVPIYFQWKEGGFKRELLKQNEKTAPSHFELPDGSIAKAGGERGKIGTRMKYPQLSHDLSVRWCSSYLKIGVCKIAITNQLRFQGIRTLVLSGERGEESPQRAKYKIWEPDVSDLRNGKQYQRHVDRHRPLINWTEEEVWAIIEKYRIRVHPCYYMGFNRCSCKFCIFGNKDQFASAKYISPVLFDEICAYEKTFTVNMKRNCDLCTFTQKGIPYKHLTPELISLAVSTVYTLSVIIPKYEKWFLPAGAYNK